MTRHFGLTQINADNLSRRTTLDGGASNTSSGSPDADTRVIPNVIQLARPITVVSTTRSQSLGARNETASFSPRVHPSNLPASSSAFYSRAQSALKLSYLLEPPLDVFKPSGWIFCFLFLWFGTIGLLIWCLFIDFE